jgi:ubiquinone biosynthesis protein UbiJ
MLPIKALEKIQELLNAVLRQDEQAFASIRKLAGKLVAIQVTGTALTVFVKFESGGPVLTLEHEAKPNVIIRGRPFTLIGLLLDRDGSRDIGITPDMEISGDTNLAQRFQEILRKVEIDWEEHLSHWIGDIAAHQVGRLFRTSRSYLREMRRTFGMNLSEYLLYEQEILPTREDVAEFVSAVDVLRNDAERLQQRFERLLRKVT